MTRRAKAVAAFFGRLLSQHSRMVICGFSGFLPQHAKTQIEAFPFFKGVYK
jgi:hypothetical protein